MSILLWLVLALVLLVVWMYRRFTTLSRAGVNGRTPVPIFGNLFWVLLKKEHLLEHFTKTVELFPDDRIVGHYSFWYPNYLIRDLEIVKKITATDFECFSERQKFGQNDPIFEKALINIAGKKWKNMRRMIIPIFSSSMLRKMIPLIVEVGDEMVHVLKRRIQDSEKSYIDVNVNDLTTRFATDAIFSCVYGLKMHTISTNDQLLEKVKDYATFSQEFIIKNFIVKIPLIAKIFNIKFTSSETSAYFYDLIMKQQEINYMEKKDSMLKLLLEKSNDCPDSDMGSQAVGFIIGGFHTVYSSLNFLLYELARNPGVQKKLVQEIKEYDAKCGGELDFDTLKSMTYLDMVVSEALRLWPVGNTDRRCVKDYNLGKPNKKATTDLTIRKGEIIFISPWLFHRDPKLFPDPQKFDPERFSPENKANIKPYSYMPFGLGPRQCVAKRFALLEFKLMVYILLRELEISLSEKICSSDVIHNSFFLNISKIIRFQIRSEK